MADNVAAPDEASQSSMADVSNQAAAVPSKQPAATPTVNVGRFSIKTKNVTPRPPTSAARITEELNDAADAESPPPSEPITPAVPAAVGAVVTTGRFTIVTPPVSVAAVQLVGAQQVRVAPPGQVSPERRYSMPSILEGNSVHPQEESDSTNLVWRP